MTSTDPLANQKIHLTVPQENRKSLDPPQDSDGLIPSHFGRCVQHQTHCCERTQV
jgi:hypothetical protein